LAVPGFESRQQQGTLLQIVRNISGAQAVFIMLCMHRSVYSVSMCCAVYCLCVNVYCLCVNVYCLCVNVYCLCVNVYCLCINVYCLCVNVYFLCVNVYCLCVNVYWTAATELSGHFSTTLTEVLPCLFLSCKANARI
jgi:hypothetical protein